MLEIVEYIDIDLVIRSFLLEKLTERVLDIVLVLKLKDRLVNCLAKPYDRFPYELRSPLARSDEPRSDYP